MSFQSASKSVILKLLSSDLKAIVELKAAKLGIKLNRAIETSLILSSDPLIIHWFQTNEKDFLSGELVKKKILDILLNYEYSNVFVVNHSNKHNYLGKNKVIENLVLDPKNTGHVWYFNFIQSKQNFDINIDRNETLKDTFAFINVLMGTVEQPIGAAGIGMNLTDLSNEFSAIDQYGGRSWLIDPKGTIKISSELDDIGKNISELLGDNRKESILKAQNETNVSEYEDRELGRMFYAHSKLSNLKWIVVYRVSYDSMTSSLTAIRFTTLLSSLIAILLTFLVFYIASMRITSPIKILTEGTKKIAKGNLSLRFDIPNQNEIGELAKAFNFMTESLQTTNQILSEYNLSLEQKVSERTKELNNSLHLIKRDMILARKIQTNILPKNIELIHGLRVNVKYIPMEEVGGDFFDIVEIKNGHIRFFIADATGHGVQASLITMVIKGEYESLKYRPIEVDKILELLNKKFMEKYENLNTYFTCFVLDIDVEAGKMTYSSAGHPEQFLLKLNEGQIIELPKTGKIIGLMNNAKYKKAEFDITRGDKIFLFTDGIFEQFNNMNDEYGETRLKDIILNKYKNNDNLIDQIYDDLKTFIADQEIQDDITFLEVEIS